MLGGIALTLTLLVALTRAEILTPPYFNLAEGRKITASATCGVDTEDEELYCKLVGANAENDINVNLIQGQLCDVCDPTRPDKMHPPEFAVDGMETWWQSPPLSRGMKYNEVNLTINLGQEFHVAYVYIRMGNSPRPGLWVLEKSADYGITYTPWQYFSDSPADCETYFGRESLQPITRDDSVICSIEYSKIVPLEGGEIPVSILNNRPSANNYFNSSVLQEWTRATDVRLRLLRTKNFLGHLMSVARQDPTVTRRYFYSIKDISIGGRCMCNGHADTCDIQDPADPSVLLCRCQHHTCGPKCSTCCSGFEQKAWRQSKSSQPFVCEPCNCFQHSNECIYDSEVDIKGLSLDIHGKYEGGGVCQNCQHNTEGINCNHCKSKFYRPYDRHWNETNVCQPCDCDNFYSTGNCAEGSGQCECRKEFTPPNCDSCSFGYYDFPECKPCECYLNGTENLQCEPTDGECPCKFNYGGIFCDQCAEEYYNFPVCESCECNPLGAISGACTQETGNCICKNNYGGKQCYECQNGYFSYPSCTYCSCDIKGTKEGICDKETGQCLCKEGYGGERCDQCIPEYFGYPNCKPCNCSLTGSASTVCDTSGKCPCLENFAGRTCEQCSPGYYNYPECLACNCDSHGSNGISCDNEGRCQCHYNFNGSQCQICKEGFYNFPSCEDCNCNPAGVVAAFAGCGSVPAGELCQCKERVQGRICDQCRPHFWNLNNNNPEGCEECNCNKAGVLGGIEVCDTISGQCVCKPSVIARGCSECADGAYNLEEGNLFGCSDCGCDIGGSVSRICDKLGGQCYCQSRVRGRTCKEPLQAHYFPTLYQFQHEVEDGRTLANTAVRYAYDEDVFPGYSWKGYAVFSLLQNEILQDLYINKPSLYRMVLRYVNLNPETVVGTIKITPENPNDIEQKLEVQFKNTSTPTFVTVSGATGIVPSPLVMNPGKWTVSIQNKKSLFLDYFVLLPEDFYLATLLNQQVETPCIVDGKGLCRDYSYPNVSRFDSIWGAQGYVSVGDTPKNFEDYYIDRNQLSVLNVANRVPILNSAQSEITYNITVSKPGPYVIVINYVTPIEDQKTHTLSVITTTENSSNLGKAILYSCPYTTVCRQVVNDQRNSVAVHHISGNLISVELMGENANVGIHSVVAIPSAEWSLEYIKPKPVCIRKDGKCIHSSYPNPPESKKVQFEQEIELAHNRTPVVFTNTTSYVYLNSKDNMIDLRAKTPQKGEYVFVVQYYQPDFPEFSLDVIIQNGKFYEAKLPVPYCPSVSGCRSVIREIVGNAEFSLLENFMITVKEPNNKGVYLDYLLVIPADLYTQRILEEENVDRTGEFISTCGSNHFNIDTSVEGFCRDSVFSLTAGYNGGALPCQCDYDGSLSFECDKFGGQCLCKDNIIGRQCEACKTGYYGFPECKPCNCPSTALCETSTGQCICPPHVTGERCDQCMPYTYGFDPIIGCEECKCSPLGVDKSLQCDLLNGSCPCKTNIVGRQCDVCLAGYYAFPYCDSCECDLGGTTEEICDQQTAQCFCKKHVAGPACDLCKEGTFNLQESNVDGCTECFCFGKTTRCSSSNFIRIISLQMEEWNLVEINETDDLKVAPLNLTVHNLQNTVGADFTGEDVQNKTVYFAAPEIYLGRKLTAYGGFLNYTIFYTIGHSGKAVSGADLILEGTETYLVHTSFEQPAVSLDFAASIQLVESNFQLPNGVPARREHIMVVLQNLRAIYIRATYWTASITTRLTNVLLDDAIPFQNIESQDRDYEYASTVEQCQCPPNYQGLSCEECAPGFYRISSGPHGGYCVPCQCNGHADECDVNTGICLGCKHNTRGDHCEQCSTGYHGNALQGTPMDCLICACPLPVTSNNFASACDLSSDGEKISCECNDGYIGGRCQSCGPGFYGRPEVLGDFCKPCQCSGNIDPNAPGSCDTVTGTCLQCLNNTFGAACALCSPGYFGDAITAKDCQACVCDELGTQQCNSYTGQCTCKPNVIGEKCDRCALEHYGFQSGQGCVPCNCGLASDSAQCDDVTGQCRCKPGVTARTCDKCTSGYWNYTAEGCVSCGCKSEYSHGFGCSAQTGQCECLNGVIGEKCDHCEYRWAFVPDYGCHECDSCVHNLLDDTDHLSFVIDPVIKEFDSVDSGYFTTRRLVHINDTLHELRPKVEQLDPNQVNLIPIEEALVSLEHDSKQMNRKANYSLENSESLLEETADVAEESLETLDEIFLAVQQAKNTIKDVSELSVNFAAGEGPKIDSALQEAQRILDEIKIYNLTGRNVEANTQLNKTIHLLRNVTNLKRPVDNIGKHFENLKADLKKFNEKLDDLYNHTQYSLNKAAEADLLNSRNGKDRVLKKLETVENQTKESEKNLNDSEQLLLNATSLLNHAQNAYAITEKPNSLEHFNNVFNTTLENNYKELTAVENLVPKVQTHASNLSHRAEELDNLLSETRDTSVNAVKAAKAYQNIVDTIKEAQDAASSAVSVDNEATDLLDGLEDASILSDDKSRALLADAHNSYLKTVEELKPQLEDAVYKSRHIRSLHQGNDERLKNIDKFVKHHNTKPLDETLIAAKETAEEADVFAQNTLDIVSVEFSEVPEKKEKAKQLDKDLNDVENNIASVKNQIQDVDNRLPGIVLKLKDIPVKQEELKNIANDIENKIKTLNQQVALARDIANRIKVGVKFYPNTTLELRNPPNLADLSTSTHISGYFKTNKTDGSLFYLGNGNSTNLRRAKTDDFMALELINGYLVLNLDVGNGLERIVNDKYVADGNWYQFIIDRTGHNAKLTVREEVADGRDLSHTTEQVLQGPKSIFNLNSNQSKVFVGSCPLEFPIQSYLQQNSFQGEMEELVIGDQPMSLWNFNFGIENNRGALQRDKLVNLRPSTGYRFNGEGYAILNGRSHSFRSRSDIQISFKTFATEGLLFLVGTNKTFISIEIRNGKILYQYNLGSGTKVWYTAKAYNDGKWHTVRASREGANGRFTVDDEDIQDRSPGIGGNAVEPPETIFFGGFPQHHNFRDVTNTDFDGCIDNVIIMGNPVDLSQNIKAYDVTPGCPVKFARLVSFSERRPGYIKQDNISVDNIFQVTLKFKTKTKDGLIFYATDRDQSAGISLSLSNGQLKLISQKTELVSKETDLNDNEWHVVTVKHDPQEMRLDFDDNDDFDITDGAPPLLHILYGEMYIGGLPKNYIPKRGMTATNSSFIGCIGDATLNGNVINFANSTDKLGEVLGKCVLDKQIGSDSDVHSVPVLPPIEEIVPLTTEKVVFTTEDPYLAGLPKRGDGGKDIGEDEYLPTDSPPAPAVTQTPTPRTETPSKVQLAYPTTFRPQPITTTVKQPPVPSCALPLIPAFGNESVSSQYRFGTEKDSRLEYSITRGKHKKHVDFSIEFKTTAPEGIIFYESDMEHSSFLALLLRNGYVIYTFSGGPKPVVLKSPIQYNDDTWHLVDFTRSGPEGKLFVDNELVAEGRASESVAKIDLHTPFYIGGIRTYDYSNVLANLNTTEAFSGCLRNFNMNNKPMEQPKKIGVIPCSNNVESGTYFGYEGGYMRLKSRFKVGFEIDIKMDIKPRNVSGLLVSVHGKLDYLVLEMVNGVIKLTVENGKGAITTSFQSDNPHYFCDGNWHNIQAVKSKNVVTLSVDRTYTDPGVGDYRAQSTDTGGALFLGGHRVIHLARGLTSRAPFVGCIKNVLINNNPYILTPEMAMGHVTVGSCPTV